MGREISKNELKQLLSKNLRYVREYFGYTQEEFAERCCIESNYYISIENGYKLPSSQKLANIVTNLSLPYDILFLGLDDLRKQSFATMMVNYFADT
ncbi:MAG: helix-turn-helix domain-containing protein [Eubacterium sp.]|nr:helix-turn-helix domain-containing protein [Eubacterium sp.]